LTALHFASCPTTSHQHVAGRSPEPLIAKNTELHERRKHLSCHSWRLYHTLPTARNCVTGSESQAMLDALHNPSLWAVAVPWSGTAARRGKHSIAPHADCPSKSGGLLLRKSPQTPAWLPLAICYLPSAISYSPSAISQRLVILAVPPPSADISPPALRPQSRSPLRRRH